MAKGRKKAQKEQLELREKQLELQKEQLEELRNHRKSRKLGLILAVSAIVISLAAWYYPRQTPYLTQSQEQKLDSVPPIQQDSATYIIPKEELDEIASITRERLEEGAEINGMRLVQVGNSYIAIGDPNEALFFFRSAMRQPGFAEEELIRLAVLFNLASAHCKLENYDSCLIYRERALDVPAVEEIPGIKADLLNGVGTILLDRGLWKSALAIFKNARSMYSELGDTDRTMDVDGNIANAQFHQGLYSQALSGYTEIERYYRNADDSADSSRLAQSLHNIGNVHFVRKHLAEALAYYRSAQRIHDVLDDGTGKVYEWSAIGMVFADSNETDSAIYYLVNAIEKSKQAGDTRGEANVHGNLGNVYLRMGDTTLARQHFERALSKHRSIPYPQGVALASAQLGHYYEDRGEIDSAIHYMESADFIMKSYNLPRNHAEVVEALLKLRWKRDHP